MKSSCYSCHILVKGISFTDVLKNYQMLNFMKIRPVGSELLHEDGCTDRQVAANNRFHILAKAFHKKGKTDIITFFNHALKTKVAKG